MFGRRFAEVVKAMGGRKVKINGRAYFEGVVLQPSGAEADLGGKRKKWFSEADDSAPQMHRRWSMNAGEEGACKASMALCAGALQFLPWSVLHF
jgi:hypothetical protein